MKRIFKYALVGLLFATVFLSVQNATADEYAQGKTFYSDKCQICHGVNGKGDGPAASALSPKPVDFSKPSFWQGDVDKKITETIENGHGMMPAFDLKPAEIKDIIDYISHTFKPKQ